MQLVAVEINKTDSIKVVAKPKLFTKLRSRITKQKLRKEFSRIDGNYQLIEVEDFGQQISSKKERN